MKKLVFTLSILLLIIPIVVSAHAGEATTDFTEVQTGSEMMRYIEDQALGEELHEEMENLMVKMMAGNMTEAEAGRMAELMEQHPGPQSMMMGRMMGANFEQGFGNQGMMGFGGFMGGGGLWSLIMVLISLMWLAIGALAIVWLWKQVSKK